MEHISERGHKSNTERTPSIIKLSDLMMDALKITDSTSIIVETGYTSKSKRKCKKRGVCCRGVTVAVVKPSVSHWCTLCTGPIVSTTNPT